MLAWLEQYQGLIGIVVQAATALIWAFYLRLIYSGFVHARESVILLHIAVSRGRDARCLVTNMGAEPIYLLAIVMQQKDGKTETFSQVTDRDELNSTDCSTPSQATNQGPLAQGDFRDIGDFKSIEQRARNSMATDSYLEHSSELTLYIVATSGHKAKLVGCYQTFALTGQDGDMDIRPQSLRARQITNYRRRKWRKVMAAVDGDA